MLRKLFNATALLAVGLAIAYNWYFTYDHVTVDIDKGTLRGFNTTTWRGTEYFVFRGIPYAKPPVGDLRFKAPQEEAAWDGVRDAISHGLVCPQPTMMIFSMLVDEDCLFLNVYTPLLRSNGKLPVMVWFHGGGFFLGAGTDHEHGPDYFIDAGVVVVMMNYRLGALGFLSTGDEAAPGNAGMKDQVAALKWVKRNIAKFGGDPDNVTIFGVSAGGASVHYHLLSPMSSGLFARAIGQSGSAMSRWALSEVPVERAIRLAEALKGENLSGDKAKALDILKTASYKDIVRTQGRSLLTDSEERTMALFPFTPSVENKVESDEAFLPDSPRNLLESGNFNKVPYMTGYTDKEGYLFLIDTMKPKDEFGAFDDTERYVPREMRDENLRNDLAKSIGKLYFKDEPVGSENISSLMDLYTDIHFAAAARRATELQLRASEPPIYFYQFSYDGGLNLIKKLFRIDLPGAAHGDELGYLFYRRLLFWMKPEVGSEDEHVMNTMIRLWTNFAKCGNPTPAGDPLTWKPATLREFNFLNISGWDTKLDVNPDAERAQFWADAFETDAAIRQGH